MTKQRIQMDFVRFSMTMPRTMMDRVDKAVRELGFASRSEIIRTALNEFLEKRSF